MSTSHTSPIVASFPPDHRDLDAPHRRLLGPLVDLLSVARRAALDANDASAARRLDEAWILVVAAAVDTEGRLPLGLIHSHLGNRPRHAGDDTHADTLTQGGTS